MNIFHHSRPLFLKELSNLIGVIRLGLIKLPCKAPGSNSLRSLNRLNDFVINKKNEQTLGVSFIRIAIVSLYMTTAMLRF
jgi:hypothetical protein